MKMMRCKKCEPVKYFRNFSTLRKHQWKAHHEVTLGKRGLKKKQKELIPIVQVQAQSTNGEMKVSELLDKLKIQRDFMQNVVAMIEGLVKG